MVWIDIDGKSVIGKKMISKIMWRNKCFCGLCARKTEDTIVDRAVTIIACGADAHGY